MASMSKQKGASFERRICQIMSRWISEGTRDDLFWRSAMSGGRATIGRQHGKSYATQCGDLTAIDPLGAGLTALFMVECKFYRTMSLDQLLYDVKGTFLPCWIRLCFDARAHSKMPMMIVKENRRPEMLCLRESGIRYLMRGPNYLQARVVSPKHRLAIYLLSDLLLARPDADIRGVKFELPVRTVK